MDDASDERWLNLCRLAENEHDPAILLELVTEINRLLGEKEARLHPKIESANLTPVRYPTNTEQYEKTATLPLPVYRKCDLTGEQ